MSTHWNQQLIRYALSKVIKSLEQSTWKQISIAKEHRVQNKWTEYKLFELKYANTNIMR